MSDFFDTPVAEITEKIQNTISLLPAKFTTDNVSWLPEYLEVHTLLTNYMMGKIEGLANEINPETININNLKLLGALINAELLLGRTDPNDTSGGTDTTVQTAWDLRRRKELSNIIDWYKVRGTYLSIEVIQTLLGLSLHISDVWATYPVSTGVATSYENMTKYDKWEGYECEGDEATYGTYPPELHTITGLPDTTYGFYKTPHLVAGIALNFIQFNGTYNGVEYQDYLWLPQDLTLFKQYIEKTRPVNVVPEYAIEHKIQTSESGEPFIIWDSQTIAKVTNWSYSTVFFDEMTDDEPPVIKHYWDTVYDPIIKFDNSETEFFESIDGFVLGCATEDEFDVVYGPLPSDSSATSGEAGWAASLAANWTGYVYSNSSPSAFSSSYLGADEMVWKIEFPTATRIAALEGPVNNLGLFRSSETTDGVVLYAQFPNIVIIPQETTDGFLYTLEFTIKVTRTQEIYRPPYIPIVGEI